MTRVIRKVRLDNKNLLIVLAVIQVSAIFLTIHLSTTPKHYPEEVLAEVQEEAQKELADKGMLDRVAILTYDNGGIVLGFYGEKDPIIIQVVKDVINKKAPGAPLKICENITVTIMTRGSLLRPPFQQSSMVRHTNKSI